MYIFTWTQYLVVLQRASITMFLLINHLLYSAVSSDEWCLCVLNDQKLLHHGLVFLSSKKSDLFQALCVFHLKVQTVMPRYLLCYDKHLHSDSPTNSSLWHLTVVASVEKKKYIYTYICDLNTTRLSLPIAFLPTSIKSEKVDEITPNVVKILSLLLGTSFTWYSVYQFMFNT